jgi:hypothetical protein
VEIGRDGRLGKEVVEVGDGGRRWPHTDMGQTPVVVGGDASWIGEAVEDLRINDEQVEGEPQQWTCVKKMRRMGNNLRIQADSAQVVTLVSR